MNKFRQLLRKPATYVALAFALSVVGVSADEAALAKIGAGIEVVLELVQPSQP